MKHLAALTAVAAAFVALAPAAGSSAGRPCARFDLAVAYSSSRALDAALADEPAVVLARIPALRVARIRVRCGANGVARRLRTTPGIRYVEATVPRTRLGEPIRPATALSAYEWQYAATHADAVPASALRAAATVTVAIVDTGADVSAPDIAA